ncbi:MAG: hypothetical protein KGZ25_15700, partial [Planctomycetes bacterium]|nr:hypothetical protein [Planctomycetota bacterium]
EEGIGRGPQLRSPMRLEAFVGEKKVVAEVIRKADTVKKWKSELVYSSELSLGPLKANLRSRYDCDGAMTFQLTYGADEKVKLDSLELVMDVAGPVDMCVAGAYGMEPASGWDMRVPQRPGIVWDSAKDMEPLSLYYSSFVPWMFFGSGDRGWSWVCDSDRGWVLDRDGSTITLERDERGNTTMRVRFVNHPTTISGMRSTEFALFTHPAKPKEDDYRSVAWLHWRPENYEGDPPHAALPNDGPGGISGSSKAFDHFRKKYPNGAPRLYILKNMVNAGIPALQKRVYTGEWLLNSSARVNSPAIDKKGGYGQPWTRGGTCHMHWGSRSWEDYFVYHCARMIRLGKVTGWWWDELFPPIRGICVANGMAYFRDPQKVKDNELPYQANFGTLNVRRMLKRLAKVAAENDVPNYTALWATAATTFESYARDSEMVESAAGFAKTYEIDHITRFPISGWRYAANTCKGLTTRVKPYKGLPTDPGDNPRLDRALLGRMLLHDIGVYPKFNNAEEYVGVLNALHDFGYFREKTTEFVPYWRTSNMTRYGEKFDREGAFELNRENPNAEVNVTIYRRPYKKVDGEQGYKALFVVQNDGWEPVRGRLHIVDPERIFGGPNSLLVAEIYSEYRLHHKDENAWNGWKNRFGGQYHRYFGLKDVETGGAVARSLYKRGKMVPGQIYGPIYVRPHDFRMLYGHYDPTAAKESVRARVRKALYKEGEPQDDSGKALWECWQESMPERDSE